MDYLLKQFADVKTASITWLSNISNSDTETVNKNESNEKLHDNLHNVDKVAHINNHLATFAETLNHFLLDQYFVHSIIQGCGSGYFVNRFRFHTYRFRFHQNLDSNRAWALSHLWTCWQAWLSKTAAYDLQGHISS